MGMRGRTNRNVREGGPGVWLFRIHTRRRDAMRGAQAITRPQCPMRDRERTWGSPQERPSPWQKSVPSPLPPLFTTTNPRKKKNDDPSGGRRARPARPTPQHFLFGTIRLPIVFCVIECVEIRFINCIVGIALLRSVSPRSRRWWDRPHLPTEERRRACGMVGNGRCR